MSACDVLARYHQAMIDKSADDLADLYAPDAVHVFPFAAPTFEPVLRGREAVRSAYHAAWDASPVTLDSIEPVVTYEVSDDVVVGEFVGHGSVDGRPVTVRGVLAITVANGLIAETRDYMDFFGTMREIGRLKDIVAALQ
ncbi:nuclear transport factor 2 family protein [Fodinicola acaciae]|uniref:nuclear transport factor 2 family protein n=1 Tax=Fodinicola acaciae TaxID=2681555 RepID=UPI001C9E2F61|nr:nuclear transport factor 2 family protein [Fodinicola acaciae]